MQGNRIACSDCDGEELSDPIITSLVGRQLIEVVQNSQFDLSLVFDNEIELDFFGNSDTESAIEIWYLDSMLFEFIAGHGWNEVTPLSSEGLTKDEELLANHSEQFNERWGRAVPQGEQGRFCKECAFFMPIIGKFYFWDYGLCSNEDSSNDGKLVGVHSGCNQFSKCIKIKI